MNFRSLILIGLLSGVYGSASATLFDIIAVETGSGGFGASLFHDTNCGLMCGNNIGDVTAANDGSVIGSYDDQTGEFLGVFDISIGGTVTFAGSLSFDNSTGLMDQVSFVDVTFSGIDLMGADNTLAFTEGWQCCGNNGFDPNSFKPDTVSADDSWLMTLWGANGWDNGFTSNSLVGADLRFRLIETTGPGGGTIPEPGTLAMLALGFAMVGRKRLVATAKHTG